MLCGEKIVSAIQVQSTIFWSYCCSIISDPSQKNLTSIGDNYTIVDFREATFYISGGCFQISFEKWPKELQERIHMICTTSLLRKR
jgi:hypothetical protein